jgi:hypothetical protein
MRSPFCLCVYVSPINFWTPEPISMKLGTYNMSPEPIPTEYLINSSHQFVCPLIIGRRRLGKMLPRQQIHTQQ